LARLFIRPFRCRDCRTRFLRFSIRPVSVTKAGRNQPKAAPESESPVLKLDFEKLVAGIRESEKEQVPPQAADESGAERANW
jgi:hypothetical protein